MDSPDSNERTAPAAEADVLGEAASNTGKLEELSGDADAAHGGRAGQRGKPDEDGSARPGVDENQAGFVKDPEKKFAP
jgi:hypothetical protein